MFTYGAGGRGALVTYSLIERIRVRRTLIRRRSNSHLFGDVLRTPRAGVPEPDVSLSETESEPQGGDYLSAEG